MLGKRMFKFVAWVMVTQLVLACGGGLRFGNASTTPVLKIVSSLPMTGASRTQAVSMAQAMQLRLDQANGLACSGNFLISYEAWDDSSKSAGRWDPALEVKNAQTAAADASVVAYLGPFNSGAAKLSIPILNQAGLAMISPAATYAGLTKPDMAVAEEIAGYYPTGVRNFARVIPADDVQGTAAAQWAKELGVATVYIMEEDDRYAVTIADAFEKAAQAQGMLVVGRKQIDRAAQNYQPLMSEIAASLQGKAPDMIFIAALADTYTYQLLKDKVAVMGDNSAVRVMGPDSLQTQALISGAGATTAEGLYATVIGLPEDSLTEKGQKFLQDYRGAFLEPPSQYTIYGYEAMSAALQAIENVCARIGDPTSRAEVRDALFAIQNFDGALGKWSFDSNGDTSLATVSRYVVTDGAYEFVPPAPPTDATPTPAP